MRRARFVAALGALVLATSPGAGASAQVVTGTAGAPVKPP